ncbi:MAG: hypothetical protein J0I06_04880 [Planctomycetes bacterium]|nr:hypothetical protein [Planctomycetota bacterium]
MRILTGVGIEAVYVPEKLISVSDDPLATQWIVHRVTVPGSDDARAAAVLGEYGLLPAPLGTNRPDFPI